MSNITPYDSYWLRDALASALKRDPADSLRDAERLASILRERARDLLAIEGEVIAPFPRLVAKGGAQ
jgi:hypothetical protein